MYKEKNEVTQNNLVFHNINLKGGKREHSMVFFGSIDKKNMAILSVDSMPVLQHIAGSQRFAKAMDLCIKQPICK